MLRSIPAATRLHRNLWLALLASIAAIAGLAVLLIALSSTALADAGSSGLLIAMAGGIGLTALRRAPRRPNGQATPDAASMHKMQQEAQLGRLQALVDSVSDTLFALDAQGRFLYASPTVLSLLGVSSQAIVGQKFLDFVAWQDVEQAGEHARAFSVSHSEETRQRVFRMTTVDGLVRHVEVRYGPPFAGDADGAVAVGVLRDVTVTFTMTQRLRDERLRLRSIVDASGAVILLVDRDLNIRLANHEFKQLRKSDGEPGEGADIIVSGLDPAVLERWRTEPLAKEDIRPVRFTRALLDAEGTNRVFSITAKPVVGPDRRLRQIVFLGVDDTERHAAERALHDADRLATLGEMAATVVHELRQPLQVIVIACEAALEEPQDTALVTQKLHRIDGQVGRANHIIEDLRVFARGAGSEQPHPFNVADAVRGAINLTAAATRNAGMKIEPLLVDGLPLALGHTAKLEQVMINLINNARDAGARTLTISTALSRSDDKAPRIEISVDDDGPGIPPAVLPRLFNAFVTTKPSGKGTGLGLRICRRIVEEMGGTIGATNRTEGGAHFVVSLPPTCGLQ
ncbi:MAG: PAS domain S-box protein [Alphaproteobacteria bacterium]|nr:PAS domain S-box protein [Alphaproteobacteria bacterium]